LLRICLIITILAGLAVGGLNFVKVKEKITTLQTNLKTETEAHRKFEADYRTTKRNLDNTNIVLKQTIATLEATTSERDKLQTDLATATKRADKLNDDLTKARQERDEAQSNLAAYEATGFKPPQIVAMGKQFNAMRDNLSAAEGENKILLQNNKKIANRLAKYESPEKPVLLPAQLMGKIMVADPKWNFVVLNVGENQGVLEDGEMLVNRAGRLVAKVKVQSVQKDRSIANVMPGWSLGEIIEGDQVIPAHPAS
jgi:cell shape-determining protein MreC